MQSRVLHLRAYHYPRLQLLEYPPNVTKETVLDRILYHVAGGVLLNTPLDEVVPTDGAWGVPWYTVHRSVRNSMESLRKPTANAVTACMTAGFELLKHVVAPRSAVTGICVIVEIRTTKSSNDGGPPYQLAYLLHGGELTGLANSMCPNRRYIGM